VAAIGRIALEQYTPLFTASGIDLRDG